MHIACYRGSKWKLYNMHFACYGVSTMIIMTPYANLHVTGLVPENRTRCIFACYWLALIFLFVTVDKEYHIIVLIARDFVFQTSIVSAGIWFISFLLAYLWFEFLSVFVYLLRLWVTQSAVACIRQPAAVSWTWTWTWTWTHISVNMVIICIYNCQTHTQLLNIVLCIIQSF